MIIYLLFHAFITLSMPYTYNLPLSLIHTHTHTHTHSQNPTIFGNQKYILSCSDELANYNFKISCGVSVCVIMKVYVPIIYKILVFGSPFSTPFKFYV